VGRPAKETRDVWGRGACFEEKKGVYKEWEGQPSSRYFQPEHPGGGGED